MKAFLKFCLFALCWFGLLALFLHGQLGWWFLCGWFALLFGFFSLLTWDSVMGRRDTQKMRRRFETKDQS